VLGVTAKEFAVSGAAPHRRGIRCNTRLDREV
jgi:hypothetical protein